MQFPKHTSHPVDRFFAKAPVFICCAAALSIVSGVTRAQSGPQSAWGGHTQSVGSTATVQRQQVIPGPAVPLNGPKASQKMGAEQLNAGAGIIFLENGLPSLVGSPFVFDPFLGDWVLKKPAMTIPLDENYVLHGTKIEFKNAVSNHSLDKFSSFGINVSAAYGLVKGAASYSDLNTSSSNAFDNAFSFVATLQYEPKMLDLLNPQGMTFLPEAQAILAMPDSDLKKARWRETFGDFVAIGYDVRAHLGLKVSLTNTNSTISKSKFAELSVKYKALAGGVNIGMEFSSLAKEVISNSGMSLSIDKLGDKSLDFHLPASILEIDESSEQTGFINSLLQNLNGSHAKVGLILVPWSAIPGVPAFDPPSYSGPLLGEAALVAAQSSELLLDAQKWNYPHALVEFLQVRTPLGENKTYSQQLTEARAKLVAALDDLWLKLVSHTEAPGNPGTSEALTLAIANVKQATGESSNDGLSDVLFKLDSMKDTLPSIEVKLDDNHTPYGPKQWLGLPLRVRIKNVAAFSDVTELVPWFRRFDSGSQVGSLVLYEDFNGGQPNQLRTFANTFLDLPVLMSVTPSNAPNAHGLRDIVLQFECGLVSDTVIVDVQTWDDLGRFGMKTHNLNEDWSY